MDKKNQHILAINHILAEFDIETQVKKIALETLDAYMKGYIYRHVETNRHSNSSKNPKINSLSLRAEFAEPKATIKTFKPTLTQRYK